MSTQVPSNDDKKFSGNIYIFHAFDIGDDIDLAQAEQIRAIRTVAHKMPRYFKNYHNPLSIELPDAPANSRCMSCKIHNFGVISLTYRVPFNSSLEDLRVVFNSVADQFNEQSLSDARAVYKQIERTIAQPNFSKTQSSYMVIQLDPVKEHIDLNELQKQHGATIASLLRFETVALSEHQIREIWESARGYFRGDLIIIDTDAAFIYDDEYTEVIDLFEFANIQALELRYFDRMLDQKLNSIYEGNIKEFSSRAPFLFIGSIRNDPIEQLGKLRVDISVITERLESSIKLAGEPYLSELYDLLVDNLDLKAWREGIERKLRIVESVQRNYQHKIETNREGLLSVLIVVLIFIELVVGLLHYYSK